MYVLVLSAGTNQPSNSETLADAFIAGMNEEGVTAQKLRIADLAIEHFSLRHYEPHAAEEVDVRKVRETLQGAAGLVIASPIWNFGVPAHLKNLIDRCGSFALDRPQGHGNLKGLPFFLLLTGGAPAPAWKTTLKSAISGIPLALQYFGATHAGTHFESKCTPGRGRFGLVVHERPESLRRVREAGRAFARIARKFGQDGSLPPKLATTNMLRSLLQRILGKFL
ncbi:MAG: NAD(P)H-dependent oxidoreductase [Candidatus Peribacteraceae bacterium]|nr:NAD(P)H-dependent oxidoreductase [Candidatus Peribacteraceae bacterium]MDD5740339.1 NAD(P)H-dependent oxidoreductase [Candidatus Peribacteraceae bacterium]